jgi:hypothetical protein
MAVNHADGTIFTAMVFCPIAAGWGAARAGAGLLTPLFIPVGLAIGVGVFMFARKPVYVITGVGMNLASKLPKGWLQHVAILPFFVVYLFLPLAIVWGTVFGVFAGSMWLVRHLL